MSRSYVIFVNPRDGQRRHEKRFALHVCHGLGTSIFDFEAVRTGWVARVQALCNLQDKTLHFVREDPTV